MVLGVILLLAARLDVADSGAVCYALRVEPWSLPGYATLRLPDTVRLSRGPTAHGGALRPELGRGAVFGGQGRPFPGTPNWRRAGADSLTLRWSDGFTGVVLRARVRGDSLSGRAETFTDVRGSPQASAAVSGGRAACPGARAG